MARATQKNFVQIIGGFALFEFAIESQNGCGDPKSLALNIIKGFFAVNLFCNVPVQSYGFAVSLQRSMSADMTGLISPEGSGTLLNACLDVSTDFYSVRYLEYSDRRDDGL